MNMFPSKLVYVKLQHGLHINPVRNEMLKNG